MASSPEIKVGKAKAYLLRLVLSLLIYFIGQGIFFINTAKAKGEICDVWGVPALPYAIPFVIIMALISGFYYDSKYMVISKKPLKLRFGNY